MHKHFLLGIFLILFSFLRFFSPSFAQNTSPLYTLPSEGSKPVVDYTKYGEFIGIGTKGYEYQVHDEAGLNDAVGMGIYPNQALSEWESYRSFIDANPNRNVWDYSDSDNPEYDFYAWYAAEDQLSGVKLFYIGESLRRSGHVEQAIKAYYAALIHFPQDYSWAPEKKYYWHIAPEAISRIRKLCSLNSHLGVQLFGARVEVDRKNDNDPQNDEIKVWPGEFIEGYPRPVDTSTLTVVEERGGSYAKVVKFDNGHWQLQVNGNPFVIKGVHYGSTKVGESPHAGTLRSWMNLDDNRNSLNDGMFDSWIDSNKNNRRDKDEPSIGDAKLLKDMGANAIRYYHTKDISGNYDPDEYNKPLMRQLHEDYGIYFIMGDFLGAYTIGSEAPWDSGTDYRVDWQKENMMRHVREMVMDHKDEPYVLMWLLGNENQSHHTRTNAAEYPEIYAKFVNDVAMMIKELDGTRPVAIGNLVGIGLPELAEFAPEIDVFGTNIYAGKYSMGSVVQAVKHYYDRPLLFTEWGSDAYHRDKGEDESSQAEYLVGNWKDIQMNLAGDVGEGNVIGGVLFQWMDEWWKSTAVDSWGDPDHQNTQPDFPLPFKDGWSHEEWLGIMSQGNGRQSPFLRQVRQAYYDLKELWYVEPSIDVVENKEEDVFFYYQGAIAYVDHKTGHMVLIGEKEGEKGEMIVKLNAVPEEVYVTDSLSHFLEFNQLATGDMVSVDCRLVDGQVIVEDIFVHGIKVME